MAAPIVRTFLIDTTQAEQSLKSLNVVSAATQVTIDALYAELLKLDTALSGVAPDSAQFTELSNSIAQVEQSISTIETGKLQDVATDLQGIGSAANNIDTANIEKLEGAIDDVAPAASASAKAIDDIAGSMQDIAPAAAQTATAFDDISDSVKQVDGSKLGELEEAQTQVEGSSKSLKLQLRELQAQLANTDPDSAKYRELSQAAGELKDKIQDAAQAVGTQAGGAFERVGGSLGLVTSRIASLDFEGAAEGAKLLAENIGSIKPGDITKGIKGIGSALGSVGKALLTNPIFLIGAAIAAAVIYSKELLSLIDGVTDADQALLEIQKEKTAQAKQQFDAIGAQEESLKRQGLSEKEILQLKLDALDAAILEAKITAQTTAAQAQGQIDAAKRNADYLKTFLEFISIPQRKLAEFFEGFINSSIGILNKLGFDFEKIDIVSKFDDVNNFIVKKIFDPEQVQKDTAAATAAAAKELQGLENTRDGLLNARDAKNKAAADKAGADAKTAADKAAADQLKAQEEVSDLLNQLYEENVKEFEDAEKKKTAAAELEADKRKKAEEDYNTAITALRSEQDNAYLTDAQKEVVAIDKKYQDLLALAVAAGQSTQEVQEAYSDALIAQQNREEETVKANKLTGIAQRKALIELEYDARIAAAKGNADAIVAIEAEKEQKIRDERAKSIAQALEVAAQGLSAIQGFADASFNKQRLSLQASKDAELLAFEQSYEKQFATVEKGSEAEKKLTETAAKDKEKILKRNEAKQIEFAKKQFEAQKKMQLAGAVIDAAKAINASLAAAPLTIGVIPSPIGIASLATTIATGAASVAKIASTKFESPAVTGDIPAGGVSGGGGDGGGDSAAPQFNPLAASFLEDRPDQVTPRAYVLAGDVASQQEVRTKVEDLARIG